MQYCNYCKVYMKESRDSCCLCGNTLPESSTKFERVFPKIVSSYESNLALKIMIFISIISIVTSFSIRLIFPSEKNWPLMVLLGLITMWIGIASIIKRQYHIPKKIIQEILLLGVLAIFWDWKIGWRGWSLDFFIPISCVVAMIIMYIIAKITKLSVKDYITYALINAIFGIIPLVFFIFGWLNTVYPSIISISLSIIFLSAIFIFQGKNIILELSKKMHI